MEIIKAKIGALKKPNKIDKSPARLIRQEFEGANHDFIVGKRILLCIIQI